MPPIIKVSDSDTEILSSEYPYGKFDFEKFNVVQSRVLDFYEEDCNALIASKTGTGKTAIAEMFIAHEARKRLQKSLYISPLKALSKEKIDDWTKENHQFSDLNIAICTGDFKLTPDRVEELNDADIILMTSEMLTSRLRNYNSENNEWIKNIGTLIIDEAHLIGASSRGNHLEVGIMNFTKINPSCRLILLSATMPNVSEIGEWISYVLTQRKTYVLESTFRPCPLGIYYETYKSGGSYAENEKRKIVSAYEIIKDYPEDKFLIFSHTRDTCRMMRNFLNKNGIEAEQHHSALDKKTRSDIEKRFRSGDLSCVVATSGLAQGLNFPARRVIVLGVHRAFQEVENFEIWQMVGRAGRPGFDSRGDAYILIPQEEEEEYVRKLSQNQRIESRIIESSKTLAFHIVSEIHHGNIRNINHLYDWYDRSLAKFQNDIKGKNIDNNDLLDVIKALVKCGAIIEKDGFYQITGIGVVSSLFYYSPFDVSDLKRNFDYVFNNHFEDDDLIACYALSNIDTIRSSIMNSAERNSASMFYNLLSKSLPGIKFNSIVKGAFAYHCMLSNEDPLHVISFFNLLRQDVPRLFQVLTALDSMAGKWNQKSFLSDLRVRLEYGVNKKLVKLCRIPDIGKVRAEKLWNSGIRTYNDFKDPERLSSILKLKISKCEDIIRSVNKLNLS